MLLNYFKMDFKRTLKTSGTLFGLSLLTSLIASLFLCFSIASKGFKITAAIILLLFALVILFLAFFRGDEKTPKISYICVGICDLLTAIIWFCINQNFHIKDSYLNRVVIYAFLTISYTISIACFWPLITRRVFGALLAENRITEKQETLLYIVLNVLYAFIIALVVPISSATSVSTLCKDGIVYSIGFWIVNALLGFLIGIFLSRATSKDGPQSIVTPISQDAAYDGIN